VTRGYQRTKPADEVDDGEAIDTTLEALVREGARRMLAAALEEEVTAFLGRARHERHERGKPFRGYRNGHLPPREVTVGVSAVEVRVPRVAKVPADVAAGGFQSQVVRRYERASATTQALFARLYLEGLATGDFEPVFRELVGETTALSATAIVRLKERWAGEYAQWKRRSLADHQYAYLWADGVYLGIGDDDEKTALLTVIGAREDGTKELLALELGYRESTLSWQELLRDLRERGLRAPLLAIGDGGLGLWAALDEVFPTTEHQRCWNHRVLNVQDKLPKRLHAEARRRLHAMWTAETQAECERLRDDYVTELRAAGQGPAAQTLLRDWDDFVRFYHYPKEHWVHLRTSNPVESIFAGVRLRTNAAKRMRRREAALYLVFKVIERLSGNWRALNGGQNLMALVLEGCIFTDGIREVRDGLREEAAMPAPTTATMATAAA
jgi:transposase-like protein